MNAVLSSYVMERADVGMVELGNRFGLAFEAFLALGVLRQMLGQNLDGGRPLEPTSYS